MVKGTVTCRAEIRGNGIEFPKVMFTPREPEIDRAEIQGLQGAELRCVVSFASVASSQQGRAVAARVAQAAFDRVAVFHSIAVCPTHIVDAEFTPVHPVPGTLADEAGKVLLVGEQPRCSIGIPSARIQTELEEVSPSGEQYFGLHTSARRSASRPEEFMHLYHILLMLCSDNQAELDEFIRRERPAVAQSPDPRPGRTNMETVFTRLRNEFAHRRAGVSLETTKTEMAQWVDALTTLTARAIVSS
jgi:hypothetical protein